ncbi:alpha/beta-hydrolase [Gloeophyllum trabeum ATCC 11539]|uniref:Alpha/beta-hydrolase n=1 Tax=Gloeophyllum trabeum (strain ATCC 11539 / FP-39264 / Madison 617) TaxID=670483 RepID=S7PVP8_GLOTA|nr:alpha/beta-hydrolase [Gloeophyllum trabeum ATCC 11539]EPQ51442.1 alpha/beta-hydrolase [Gloeophyllum trabeum ATCC 11539]
MSFIPSTRYLRSSDGARIYAEAVGDSQKPSLVFTHGVSLSAAIFDDLFRDERLLDNFYLVRYDMRGHGRSDKPETMEGYQSHLYADDFSAVVSAFDLVKPIFVGWSLGATVVADICANIRPLPLAGAVFISALPYIGPVMQSVGKPDILSVIPQMLPSSTASITEVKSLLARFVDSCFNDPDRVPFAVKTAWIGMTALQSPTVTGLVFSRPQDPAPLFEAGRKGLPLLCVCGAADPYVDGQAVVDEMRPHFPQLSAVSVAGGSHAVFYDQREDVVQALLEFGKKIYGKRITVTRKILVGKKIWSTRKKFSFDHVASSSPTR